MKRYLFLLPLLVGVVLTGCKEDKEATYTSYCYISSVSLGTVKRQMHTFNSEGKDSIYYTIFTGSNYYFTIDQRNQLIENRDSLLYGSDLSSVLLSVGYTGAVLAYRAASDTTLEWTTYSASDSMDLREPIHLYTLADDGNSFRIYTLKVNVHQQEGDSLRWYRTDSTSVFDGMEQMRSVVQKGVLTVLGKTSGAVRVAKRSSLLPGGSWAVEDTDLPLGAELFTLRQKGDSLFVSSQDGIVYSSSDGVSWTALSPAIAGLKLAAISDSLFYAVVGGKMYRSEDAIQWEQEKMDGEGADLPFSSLNSFGSMAYSIFSSVECPVSSVDSRMLRYFMSTCWCPLKASIISTGSSTCCLSQ